MHNIKEDLRTLLNERCPTRTAINDGFATIVKVDESEMTWLASLYDGRKVLRPFCNEMVIQHVCDEVETFYYIRVIEEGTIQIDCYDSCTSKQKNSREFPSFTIVARQLNILGITQLKYVVAGLPQDSDVEVLCSGIFDRVFPVVEYMSLYKECACMSQRKRRVNGRVKIKTVYTVKRPKGFLPNRFLFESEIFSISKPEKRLDIKDIDGFVMEIENSQNLDWLAGFSDRVQKSLESKAPEDERFGFLQWEKDLDGPHMQAVIIRTSDDNQKFMQLQVERLNRGVFRLDYYDDELEECQLCMIASLENPKQAKFDIVYLRKEEGDIKKDHIIFAKTLVAIFKACMVYNRVLSWEDVIYNGSTSIVVPLYVFGKAL